MKAPEKILVVRLSALGDVLLATPAVRALKRHFPSASIDWLVEKPYGPLIAGNPYAVPLVYEKSGAHAGPSGFFQLRSDLARRGYDLVVDLQGKPKTRLFHAVGKRCLALRTRTAAQAFLTLVGRDPPLTRAHAVDLFLEALAPLGIAPDGRALDLRVTAEMRAEAAGALPEGRLLGLAPGSRWETKRWPAERFAQLAAQLRARGFTPLLLGGPGDAAALAAVRAALDVTSGPGAGEAVADTAALSVGGLAAAIERCELVVAGDSGPAHMAAALGTPVVALFGPTSPERWRPLSERAQVVRLDLPCAPCSNHGGARCPKGHHACMAQLEVGPVLEAAQRAVGSTPPSTARGR